jgi:hypothetical protein
MERDCRPGRILDLPVPLSVNGQLTRLLAYQNDLKGRSPWPTVRTSETGMPTASIPPSGDILNHCGNIGINYLLRRRGWSSRKWKPS